MAIGILYFSGDILSENRIGRGCAGRHNDCRHAFVPLSLLLKCGFLIWEAESMASLLTGAGRLVIKDTAILTGAIVVLADSAKRVLNQLEK